MKNKKKGFTLVELLVVIAILAILATVSILGYTSFTKKAKDSNAQSEWSQFKNYVLAYTLDGSHFDLTGSDSKEYTVSFDENVIHITRNDNTVDKGTDTTPEVKFDLSHISFTTEEADDVKLDGKLVVTVSGSTATYTYERTEGGSFKIDDGSVEVKVIGTKTN